MTITQSGHVSEISRDDYPLLYNWYKEWVGVSKLLGTVCFGTIGYSIVASGSPAVPRLFDLHLLKWSWVVLGIGGVLSGTSIAFAYFWLDAISRATSPALIGTVIYKQASRRVLRIGPLGWSVGFTAAACTLGGLCLVVVAALRAR